MSRGRKDKCAPPASDKARAIERWLAGGTPSHRHKRGKKPPPPDPIIRIKEPRTAAPLSAPQVVYPMYADPTPRGIHERECASDDCVRTSSVINIKTRKHPTWKAQRKDREHD